MGLRLSEFTNLNQFLRYSAGTSADQADVLERLSTLKRINRPSDDPGAYRQIVDTRADLEQTMAFGLNINDTLDKLRVTEDVFNSIRSSLEDVREIAMQGTSFIFDDLERETLADQVEQQRLNIINRLNTQYEGEYLFAGTAVTTQPFQDPTTGAYSGNGDTHEVRISETDTITTNFTGDEVAFGATGQGGAEDILDIMADLVTALRNNDTTAINNEIPRLRPATERINRLISEAGTRTLRLNKASEHYASFEENLRNTLARVEDADLAEEAVELEKLNAQIDAQLRAQGTSNRQSLFDFLG